MACHLIYDTVNDTLSFEAGVIIGNNVSLFESYEEKGYKNNKPSVTVGNSGFTFTIETNFGYGRAAHLRFQAEYKGTILYSFKNENGVYGIDAPSKYFNVKPDPENWPFLFAVLCNVYKNRDNWNINECLRWQEARLNVEVIQNPNDLSKSFRGYIEMLDVTRIATCSPIMKGTETIMARELPLLAKLLLNDSKKSTNKNCMKQAIETAFEHLRSKDKMVDFIRNVQF